MLMETHKSFAIVTGRLDQITSFIISSFKVCIAKLLLLKQLHIMNKRANDRNLMKYKRHNKDIIIASIVNNQSSMTEMFPIYRRKQNSVYLTQQFESTQRDISIQFDKKRYMMSFAFDGAGLSRAWGLYPLPLSIFLPNSEPYLNQGDRLCPPQNY